MYEIIKTTLLGLFFGMFGTTLGGIIGITFKNTSNKFLSFILEFAAGLMIAIVCFDLIPEAMELSSIVNVFMGIIFGVITMIICDNLIKTRYNKRIIKSKNNNSLLKTGIVIGIGLAIHNFPEGLAIGSGFESSLKLGYAIAIAIAIHDIPERNSNVCTNENWRNEKVKSINVYNGIRSNNWNRSAFRSNNGNGFRKFN